MENEVVSLLAGLGIIGAVLVASGNPWEGHLVWLITNVGLGIHNYLIKEHGQAVMFAVYFVLALWGLRTWS